MSRKYHPCFFCQGEVREELVTVDYRWGGDLLAVLRGVPAGVCQACGEQYFKAEVVAAMEKAAQSREQVAETIQVPVRTLKVA